MNEHRLVYKRCLLSETEKKIEALDASKFQVLRTKYLVAILPFRVEYIFCLYPSCKVVTQSSQDDLPQTRDLVLCWWRHLRIHECAHFWTYCIH